MADSKSTGYLVPKIAKNMGARTPHWGNTSQVVNNQSSGAVEGGTPDIHHADCNIASKDNSDSIVGSKYEANLNLNSKINGIVAKVVRHGQGMTDYFVAISADGKTLDNKGKNRKRTDNKYIVDTYGSSTNLWGASSLKPSVINADDFTLRAAIYNTLSGAGTHWMHSLLLNVYYTDPTYSLTATITALQTIGKTIVYTLTLKNTNSIHQGYAIPVSISLPSGLGYVSQAGQGVYSPTTGKWNAILQNGTATLQLILIGATEGSKTIKASIDDFDTTISKSTTIIPPKYTLTSNLPTQATQGDTVTYTMTITSDSPTKLTDTFNLTIPNGLAFVSSSGGGSFNGSTGVWTASFTNQKATKTFVFTAINGGEFNQLITGPDGSSLTKTILIISTDDTTCFSTKREIPDYIQNLMTPGMVYTISCYSKISDSSLAYVYPGLDNFKIGVVQGSNEDIGTRIDTLDDIQRIYVSFEYNGHEIPFIKIYGQYLNRSPSTSIVRFFGYAIHAGTDISYDDPGILFDNPNYLIQNDDYALAILPANQQTNPILFDEINLSGHELDPNLITKGIGISLDYNITAEIGMEVSLIIGDNVSIKSVVLDPDKSNVVIGADRDKWNFKNIDLPDLRVTQDGIFDSAYFDSDYFSVDTTKLDISFLIKFYNTSSTYQTIQIKNVEFILYFQFDETMGNLGAILDGEHSRNYNMFFTKDFDISEGLAKDIDTLDIKKSDGELITGISNKSKTIKLPFKIMGSSLEELQERFREAVNWMSNDLDDGRRPIPKPLILDWDPDRVWMVVLNDAVDKNYDVSKMEGTAEFLIPKGSATGPLRETGSINSNNGLTVVKPLITIKATGEDSIIVKETYSGKNLILNHAWDAEFILYIDCEQNKIYNAYNVDCTHYLALNSDLIFLDRGPFDFSQSTGCVVQSVKFNEGL